MKIFDKKEKVLGAVKAKQRQQYWISQGYVLGEDFVVVRDYKNPKMYNIGPAIKL
jgi:hypothetical protein